MIDGLLVVRYAGLRPRGHTGDHESGIDDLVAELRELLLRVLGPTALAVIDEERANTQALGTVARAIEDAARSDPAFAREVTQLCDELARRRSQEPRLSDGSRPCPQCGLSNDAEMDFCASCGAYLKWAATPTKSTEAPTAEPAPAQPAAPNVETPAWPGADLATPTAPLPPLRVQREPPPRSRRARRRAELEMDRDWASVLSRHAQATIDHSLSTYVRQGRLLFNPPERMRQGRAERVTVAIAQHGGLDEELRALAPGSEEAPIHDVETTPFMEVELTGSAFSIVSLQLGNAAEQLLRPTALWQFDVTPERSGAHPLQLRVAMRIPLPGRPDERVSLPVLERTVRVAVDATYSGRRFVRTHWQWLAATLAGLGGAIAAWIKLFQD